MSLLTGEEAGAQSVSDLPTVRKVRGRAGLGPARPGVAVGRPGRGLGEKPRRGWADTPPPRARTGSARPPGPHRAPPAAGNGRGRERGEGGARGGLPGAPAPPRGLRCARPRAGLGRPGVAPRRPRSRPRRSRRRPAARRRDRGRPGPGARGCDGRAPERPRSAPGAPQDAAPARPAARQVGARTVRAGRAGGVLSEPPRPALLGGWGLRPRCCRPVSVPVRSGAGAAGPGACLADRPRGCAGCAARRPLAALCPAEWSGFGRGPPRAQGLPSRGLGSEGSDERPARTGGSLRASGPGRRGRHRRGRRALAARSSPAGPLQLAGLLYLPRLFR